MNDVTTTPEVKVESETTANAGQETTQEEVSVADLHKETPKPEKPKVVPMARLDKEIQKRKDLEARLAEYESTSDDTGEEEPEVKKLAQKLEQLEVDKRTADLNKVFEQNFNATLDKHPEYKDIANVEVIRQMAFNPANANKTYRQLLDEAYGNAVIGRRTIETTTPRGGAKDGVLDMRRAQTDTAYRHEVLADPVLRKQYNEGLPDRVFR